MKRFFLLLVALLVVGSLGALFIGPAHTTPEIFWALRVPRVLLAISVGMALSTGGVIYQGLLRNPLADPFILGTSSGASLGVLIANLVGWRTPVAYYTLSLIFAIGAILVVQRIARTHHRTPLHVLILAGVVVSTFLNALVFLGITVLSKEAFSTFFFLLGTLTESDPRFVHSSAILSIVGVAIAWLFSRELNLLAMGEDSARHLGINPEKMKRVFFLLASVLVAVSVAVSGMIGFIGLIVPHIMRLIVGPDHRVLLPASALGGALMLLIMDMGARTLAQPIEIPVGILTALCGAPFFVYVLKRKKGESF